MKAIYCLQLLNSYTDISLYDRIKLDLIPYGGYTVIFTPFCKTAIGKYGVGADVSHSLKSLCKF